jgi:predicted ribosomally synthesized peptide with nif11-like leader
MSLENVKLFYARLAVDETLRAQVQNTKTREDGQQIAKAAGFDFTPQEFEEYTSQVLEGRYEADELAPLADKELAEVIGGILRLTPHLTLIYGGPWPRGEDLWIP